MAEVLIIPGRSRVQQHFGRWRSRWGDMTADSFRRATSLSLSSSDTGVSWSEAGDFTPAVGQGFWQIRNGAARCQDTVPAGNFVLATMPTPSADVHLRALGLVTPLLPGFLGVQFGLFFRSADGLLGTAWAYCGGGFYRQMTLDFTTAPATLSAITLVAGPAWAIGESHLLGVDAVGAVETYTVDGTTLLTGAVASPGGSYNRHGIFAMAGVDGSLITRYRCVAV